MGRRGKEGKRRKMRDRGEKSAVGRVRGGGEEKERRKGEDNEGQGRGVGEREREEKERKLKKMGMMKKERG